MMENPRLREVIAMTIYRRNKHSKQFAADMALIEEIAELYHAQPINEESRYALFEMCMTIHEAGRIYGIRAERERKKYNREEAV